MAWERKYDYDAILADWNAGMTTSEIGKKHFPHLKRPVRYAREVLRDRLGIDIASANRRKFAGRNLMHSEEEKALWRKLRPEYTVKDIAAMRRAAGVKVHVETIRQHCADIKGPRCNRAVLVREAIEMRRLYNEFGWNVRDICERLNRHRSTVVWHLGGYVPGGFTRPRQPESLIKAPMALIEAAHRNHAA